MESLDLPVKRNQAFIIKYFSKTRDKFCDHILGEGDDRVEERRRLLAKVRNEGGVVCTSCDTTKEGGVVCTSCDTTRKIVI